MSAISYVWCEDCQCSHEPGTHSQIAMAHGLGPKDVVDHEWREGATMTVKMPKRLEREATPLDESLLDAQRIAGLMVDQIQELAKRVEVLQRGQSLSDHERMAQKVSLLERAIVHANEERAHANEERAHIVAVLSAFVHAPISISSLQPVLDLAVELNPSLKERR